MTYESKKEWRLPEKHPASKLDKYSETSKLIAALLISRGIAPEEQSAFINPRAESIPGADLLYNAEVAARQLLTAIKEGKKIIIHGDYDCDGVCATTILWEFLYREVAEKLDTKVDVVPYIPSRVDEGYGLSEHSVKAMLEQGAQLVVTVDCGVRDKGLIKQFTKEAGLHFIVTDHHQPPDDLKEDLDYTVVHQMYPGHEYPYQKICGSTIALLLTCAIRKELGINSEITPETPGLDLVALSTVTDIMPLQSVNRVLVTLGIKQIASGARVGLNELLTIAKVPLQTIDAYHLGFVIGPRINAAGRIGSAIDAVRLLATNDHSFAQRYARSLNSLNFKRQEMTDQILFEARAQLADTSEHKINFIHGKGWSEGIIGLAAGKIIEESGKPTIVVTENNGEFKGSARSITGFNITDALEAMADHLAKYGGHELAAGFSVKEGQFENFRQAMLEFADKRLEGKELRQQLEIDLLIDSSELSLQFFNELELLKPFGYGNKKPLLMIPQVVVYEVRTMGAGKNHMKLTFKGGGIGLSAGIMFDCAEDIEKIKKDDVLDLAGTLSLNEWNGVTEVQFQIKEWRMAEL